MDCTAVSEECPIKYSIYGYYPNLGGNVFLTAWFAMLFFPNLFFGIRYKAWTYMLALCLGCITETVGYAGRIILHSNPFSETGFQMQICCLILGPAFNTAAIYLTLKHIALVFGPEYSILKPRWYTYIFIGGDLVALVLQAIGGAMAATAGDDIHQQDTGTDIMITGISWQVFTLIIFAALSIQYLLRRRNAARREDPLSTEAADTLRNRNFRFFALAVITAFVAVFTRCVYRIIEMSGGWGNPIMQDEPSYIILEGALIGYATLVQTACHPGYCFPQLCGHKKEVPQEEPKDEPQSE